MFWAIIARMVRGIALCGLTRDEVLALAEHEHIPEIAAEALGQHLLNQRPYGL